MPPCNQECETHFFYSLILCPPHHFGTYCPRLVAEVIDGFQGVDAWDTPILQTDDQVAKIFILGHTEGMLANEYKVWLEGPGGWNNNRNVNKAVPRDESVCGRTQNSQNKELNMKFIWSLFAWPDNLGAISEDLHVHTASTAGMGHNVHLTEFSLNPEKVRVM